MHWPIGAIGVRHRKSLTGTCLNLTSFAVCLFPVAKVLFVLKQ